MADRLKEEKNVKKSFASKLQRCVKSWREYTEPTRKLCKKMEQQYASGWFDNKIGEAQPLNLIDRYVNIIAPYLVSKNPKVLIDPKRGLAATRSFARTLELAIEHLYGEIQFSNNTIRPAVINSLFSLGIVKTGITTAYKIEINNLAKDVGQPYADSIEFNDYIGDFRARNRFEFYVEGNSYCMPYEEMMDSGLYKHTQGLSTVRETVGTGDTRPEDIAKKHMMPFEHKDELREMVWVNDIWLPDEGIIVTIPEEGQGDKIMRTVEYDGPEMGPYDTLSYKYFPNSPLPIAPVYGILNLNSAINRLVTKMKSQADRDKKVMLYELGAADDAEVIRNTADGFTAGVKNTDAFKEVEFGGVAATNFPFLEYLEQQYSVQGGNLYTIGGRSVQADTLGQEQMLQANASKQLQDMVLQVHDFTRNITRKLAWYLWSDPYIQIPVVKELGGFKHKVVYTPEVREGDFFDYGFDIEPYSMAMMSPEARYQKMMQLIGQVILPTAPIAAQQGSQLNVNELVKECTRFLDVRNIDAWWISGMPSEAQLNPYQPSQGVPSNGGQGDGRFQSGQEEGSNMNNLLQHMNRTAGETSSENAPGSTVKGL